MSTITETDIKARIEKRVLAWVASRNKYDSIERGSEPEIKCNSDKWGDTWWVTLREADSVPGHWLQSAGKHRLRIISVMRLSGERGMAVGVMA